MQDEYEVEREMRMQLRKNKVRLRDDEVLGKEDEEDEGLEWDVVETNHTRK